VSWPNQKSTDNQQRPYNFRSSKVINQVFRDSNSIAESEPTVNHSEPRILQLIGFHRPNKYKTIP